MLLHKYLNSDLETICFEETKANKYWITNSYLQFPLKKLYDFFFTEWGGINLSMVYECFIRTLFCKLTFPISF